MEWRVQVPNRPLNRHLGEAALKLVEVAGYPVIDLSVCFYAN